MVVAAVVPAAVTAKKTADKFASNQTQALLLIGGVLLIGYGLTRTIKPFTKPFTILGDVMGDLAGSGPKVVEGGLSTITDVGSVIKDIPQNIGGEILEGLGALGRKITDFDMPDIPNFKWPDFDINWPDMPDFNWPDFDVPEIVVPAISVRLPEKPPTADTSSLGRIVDELGNVSFPELTGLWPRPTTSVSDDRGFLGDVTTVARGIVDTAENSAQATWDVVEDVFDWSTDALSWRPW
jgi:hypothetical protein